MSSLLFIFIVLIPKFKNRLTYYSHPHLWYIHNEHCYTYALPFPAMLSLLVHPLYYPFFSFFFSLPNNYFDNQTVAALHICWTKLAFLPIFQQGNPCIRKAYNLWAGESDWISGWLSFSFKGVSFAQRRGRQARLLVSHLVNIKNLAVQFWTNLLWGQFNKNLQIK